MEVLGTRPSDKKEASENFLTAFKLSKFLDCRSVLSGVLSTAADYAGELNMLWVHEGIKEWMPKGATVYDVRTEGGGGWVKNTPNLRTKGVTKSQKL